MLPGAVAAGALETEGRPLVNSAHKGQAFARELRRRRDAEGLTLTKLAELVHYTKGYLSKIESGLKQPSLALARQCDAALDAGGELIRLVERRYNPAAEEDGSRPITDWTWIVKSPSDGHTEFQAFDHSTSLAGTPAAAAHWTVVPAAAMLDEVSEPLAGFRRLFHEYRALGQMLGPGLVAHLFIQAVDSLRALAEHTRGADRSATLRLAARYAEYAGWMAQEMGNDRAALFWTARCVDFAEGAGDTELVGYTWVRRAGISMYREDALSTVELARRAQSECSDPYIVALALQREAQGHALAGDERACMHALEQATELESHAGEQGGEPPLGPTAMRRPVDFATGWCLHDLGRSPQAVEVLAAQLLLIDPNAVRARTRCASRLALAYTASGEVDEACAVIEPVLDAAGQVDSATLRVELRTLRHEFSRLRRNPRVVPLLPRLQLALQTPA